MAEKEEAEEEVEDEEEYESDLDDAPLPAVRRRAAASDDEEGGGASGSSAPWSVAGSDLDSYSDSDGQGAAEMYDDEEEGSEERDELEAGGGGGGGGGVGGEALEDEGKCADEEALEDEGRYGDEEADGVVAALGDEGKCDGEEAEVEAAVEGAEVVNKEGEAQAVPTIGAFYMHDDRFRDPENGRHGSQRKNFGGQKLWYPKDDNVWAHDRFYEMNSHHDRLYETNSHNSPNDSGRGPRGSFRAWGGDRTHRYDHGYVERTLSQSYCHDDREEYKYVPKEPRTFFATTRDHISFLKESNNMYGSANNYKRVPSKFHTYYDHGDTKNFAYVQRESHTYYGNAKDFTSAHDGYRGGVSNPYVSHWRSDPEICSGQYIRSQNEEASSNAEGGKYPSQTLGFQTEKNFPMKQTSPSNLNSASPSFYHSRSSHQEQPFIQRGKARAVMFSKLFTSSVRMAHNSLKPQSRPVYRVKAVVPSGRGNTLDSLSTNAMEEIDNPGSNLSGSASDNYIQYSKSSDKGTVKTELKEEVEGPSFTYDEGHVINLASAKTRFVELDLLHIQLYCRKIQCLLKTKSQTNPFNSILFSKALIFVLYSKIQQSLNYSRARSQVFIRLDHAEITIWIGRNGQWREEAPGPCFTLFRPSCSYIRDPSTVAPPSEHVHVVVWFKTRQREPT
uniref:Btz domain-containing protein n=1 Tax=Oryza nivara TaxID=4536 RepID=A0A0E0FSC1_ORYNI